MNARGRARFQENTLAWRANRVRTLCPYKVPQTVCCVYDAAGLVVIATADGGGGVTQSQARTREVVQMCTRVALARQFLANELVRSRAAVQ